MRFMFTLFVVLTSLFVSCDSDKKTYSKDLISIAKASNEKEVTKKQIKTLMKTFHESKHQHDRQKTARMVVYALQSNGLGIALQSFRRKVEKAAPRKQYFSFLNKEFPDLCSLCNTKGYLPCKLCPGDGKCPNTKCKKGEISYLSIATHELGASKKKSADRKNKKAQMVTKTCSQCKGSLKCSRCDGSGTVTSKCPKCRCMGRFNVVKKSKLLYQKEVSFLLK